jgi:hypothetical protein
MLWRNICHALCPSTCTRATASQPAQETRIAKLLVALKGRLAPFMAGEAEAFREVQVRRRAWLAVTRWLRPLVSCVLLPASHTLCRVRRAACDQARLHTAASTAIA